MHVVKSVGVMSFAKVMALIYGCMGVLAIPLFLFMGLVGTIAGQERNPLAGTVGVVFAILAPFIYAVMGFVIGAIGALLYNLFARWAGGIELELTLQPPGPVAPYPIVPAPTPSV